MAGAFQRLGSIVRILRLGRGHVAGITELLAGLGGIAAGILLLLSCAWVAYLLSARLMPEGSWSVRLTATATLAYGILYGLFRVLLALHTFRLEVALAALLCGACTVHLTLGRKGVAAGAFERDAERASAFLVSLRRSPIGLFLVVAMLVMGARLLRGLIAPPLGWDALTYHLYNPGRWVQAGSATVQAAPDSWGWYQYFPGAGDSYWAWALLASRDGVLLAPAGILVWITVVLAAHAAARTMGAKSGSAACAALAIGLTPAVANAATAAYVDNTILALFISGGGFIERFRRRGEPPDALLGSVALGLTAAMKVSMVPVLLVALGLIAIRCARGEGSPWRRSAVAGACGAVAASVCLMEYAGTWIEKGTPFYPFTLVLGGHELLAGSEEVSLLWSGRVPQINAGDFPSTHLLRKIFFPFPLVKAQCLGLGPAWILVGALGLLAAWKIFARRHERGALLFPALASLLLIYGLMGDHLIALRTIWARGFTRYVTPVSASFALLGSVVEGRAAQAVWTITCLAGAALSVPTGWSRPDWQALSSLSLPLILGLAAAAVATGLGRRRLRGDRLAVLAVAALVLPCAAAIPRIRAQFRYPIYEAATSATPAYDLHALDPRFSSWRIWAFLDDGAPHRVAVAAGWGGMLQNCYLYPLLGSRLQNRVLYIPPTRSGAVIDYRKLPVLLHEADFDAWLRRLLEQEVDYVVTLSPPPPEEGMWILKRPDLFVPVGLPGATDSSVYKFLRQAAGRGNPI